eukprot:UN19864
MSSYREECSSWPIASKTLHVVQARNSIDITLFETKLFCPPYRVYY